VMWRQTGEISRRHQPLSRASSLLCLSMRRRNLNCLSPLTTLVIDKHSLYKQHSRDARSKQSIIFSCLKSRYHYHHHNHQIRNSSSSNDTLTFIEAATITLDDDEAENGIISILDEESKISVSKNSIDDQSLLSLLSDEGKTNDFTKRDDSISNNNNDREEKNNTTDSFLETSRKYSKKKPPPSSKKRYDIKSLPESTIRRNAQIMFDSIAPHVEKKICDILLGNMMNFTRLMEDELEKYKNAADVLTPSEKIKTKKKRKKKKEFGDYKSLVGKIDAFFMAAKRQRKKRNKKNSDASTNYPEDSEVRGKLDYPWIKDLVVNFFAGDPCGKKCEKDRQDPTYAPYSNRTDFEKNVLILMKAREVCIESPLLWSDAVKKKLSHPRQRQKHLLVKDDEKVGGSQEKIIGEDHSIELESDNQQAINIPWQREDKRNVHNDKSKEEIRTEAEALASILADHLPRKAHDKLLKLLDRYAHGAILSSSVNQTRELTDEIHNNSSDSINSTSRPFRIKFLFKHVKKATGTHIHLIASDLTNFFYMEGSETIRYSASAFDTGDTSKENAKEENGDIESYSYDPRIHYSWEEWSANREKLVNASLSSYTTYCELQEALAKDAAVKNELELQKEADEKELESIINEVKRSEEAKEKKEVAREKKRVNLSFQCIMLNDRFGPFTKPGSSCRIHFSRSPVNKINEICPDLLPMLPETHKMILVDNLPIDVTEEEIFMLYSRCGEVEYVELYNLRPDLDPGELTTAQQKEIRKRNRLSGAKATKRRVRPRTPVHAIIKFKSEAGYTVASNDMLRIFGMVIRRHPVRSIPAHTLDSLYIENLPPGFIPLDLLEKLNNLFHPDISVFLDIGNKIHAQPKSFTIKFPSFEVAAHAQQQLKQIDFGSSECTINWVETPKDAMKYWRREIGVDP